MSVVTMLMREISTTNIRYQIVTMIAGTSMSQNESRTALL